MRGPAHPTLVRGGLLAGFVVAFLAFVVVMLLLLLSTRPVDAPAVAVVLGGALLSGLVAGYALGRGGPRPGQG